jgi:hypothetical protein
LNQPGIFDEIVLYFRSILEDLPDKRTGKNKHYQMSDAALSAFSVFFTQSPSFLAHQKSMAQKKGHNIRAYLEYIRFRQITFPYGMVKMPYWSTGVS